MIFRRRKPDFQPVLGSWQQCPVLSGSGLKATVKLAKVILAPRLSTWAVALQTAGQT